MIDMPVDDAVSADTWTRHQFTSVCPCITEMSSINWSTEWRRKNKTGRWRETGIAATLNGVRGNILSVIFLMNLYSSATASHHLIASHSFHTYSTWQCEWSVDRWRCGGSPYNWSMHFLNWQRSKAGKIISNHRLTCSHRLNCVNTFDCSCRWAIKIDRVLSRALVLSSESVANAWQSQQSKKSE